MSSLSNLLKTKQTLSDGSTIIDNFDSNYLTVDTNLLEGSVYSFNSFGSQESFCWQAPSAGKAIIEVWGASGSTPAIRCCGIGVPGNPGAYVKKTVELNSGSWISGDVGCSIGNSNVCCIVDSYASCVTICNSGAECVCLYAGGGKGGRAVCDPQSGSTYCCFLSNCGLSGTNCGTGCGIVCNYCSSSSIARACGGDINCDGGISCLHLGNCKSGCVTSHCNFVSLSHGLVSNKPTVVKSQFHYDICRTGAAHYGLISATSATGQWPTTNRTPDFCWASDNLCTCYVSTSCTQYLPTGVPGAGPVTCGGIYDYGFRGGPGLVKIRFISN